MQKLKPFLHKPDGKEESSNGEKTNRDLKWLSKAQCSYWVCRAAECYL